MNRDQKAAAIAEIAANIEESQAVFAVDYRGITVLPGGASRQAARGRRQLPRRQELAHRTRCRPDRRRAAQAPASTHRLDLRPRRRRLAASRRRLRPPHPAAPLQGRHPGRGPVDAEQIRAISRACPRAKSSTGSPSASSHRPQRLRPHPRGASSAASPSPSARCARRRRAGEIPAGEPPAAAARGARACFGCPEEESAPEGAHCPGGAGARGRGGARGMRRPPRG